MTLRVGIVGCGLIGTRRARIASEACDPVVAVADIDAARALALARDLCCRGYIDWRDLVADPAVEAVVVSTFNSALAEVTRAAVEAGKDVLCEKPFGRTADEARDLADAVRFSTSVVKVGFTLRHHPAIAEAHALVRRGEIGRPFALRCAYGHGGRAGYEREWRGDANLAGGGELLDQGIHVVDLCRWFLGEIGRVSGALGTWCWDIGPLEDNGFALLWTGEGAVASVHTSWTQWRNLFRLEIFGDAGFVLVEGLGGSYGEERLVHGRRQVDGGPPEEAVQSFDGSDAAWRAEWEEFRSAVAERRDPLGSAFDGYQAMRVVDAIYRSARLGAAVQLEGVGVIVR